MNKFSVTFLMSFLIVTSAPDTKPRGIFTKTTYYEVITGDKAAKSLREIQPSEALPLVLHVDETSSNIGSPEDMGEVFVGNGRIINRTQFTSQQAGEQMFFCPKENSNDDEKCLVRKDFQPLEPLECSKEAEPIVTQEKSDKETECGPNYAGISYDFAYEICPDEIFFPETSYNFSNRRIKVYTFCYNGKEKKVIGTLHRIRHPRLLRSKILSMERNVQYDMKTMDGFILANQKILETALAKEGLNPPSNESEHHVYRAQKLVPEEDMAFALWRKPIFQYINVQLQHEKLVPLWNEINHYIRLYTEETSKSTDLRTYVTTSVFELTTVPREDGQMTNMWVKSVYFMEHHIIEGSSITTSMHGLVILMNNFIDDGNDHSTMSNLEGKTIDDYCQQNTCEESLKIKFAAVGGSIRCCSMTENVSEIFGSGTYAIGKMSRIPGINGA